MDGQTTNNSASSSWKCNRKEGNVKSSKEASNKC